MENSAPQRGAQAKPVLNGESSWKVAQKYAAHIGQMPQVFAAAVRLILSDYHSKNGALRPVTKFLVSQALRGKKILSMLYFCVLRNRKELLDGKSSVSLGELVNSFGAYDLAAVYGLYLIYRRVRRALAFDREALNELLPHLRSEAELGCVVGKAIPGIGLGCGALAGTLHHLAMGIIAIENSPGVREYYKEMERSGMRWDPYRENELFGCSSLQLGAVLLTKVGFSKYAIEQYLGAMDPELKIGDSSSGELEQIRYAKLWIDGLKDGREQPLHAMPGEYYPSAEARSWIENQLEELVFDAVSWIERADQDISRDLTPLLFGEEKSAKNVPEPLRDIFTLKEITQMSENEFDDLVDEIDISIKEASFDEFFAKD